VIAGLLVRSPYLSGRSCDRSISTLSWPSTQMLRRRTSTGGRRDPIRRVLIASIGHVRCFVLWFEQVVIHMCITYIAVCMCEWAVSSEQWLHPNLTHNLDISDCTLIDLYCTPHEHITRAIKYPTSHTNASPLQLLRRPHKLPTIHQTKKQKQWHFIEDFNF